MPIDVPTAKPDSQHDGLDFVRVLRDCFSPATIALDERRKITAFNPRAELLSGSKAAAMIGKSADALPEPLQLLINETFSTGNSVSHRQITFRDIKRGDLAVLASITPMIGPDGKISGTVIILNDVSSLPRWETNMRRLDRLHSVGTLSASMAHEVKNAFVAVRTFVDLLLEKNKDMEMAEIVRLEMNRIDSIVTQMLKFSGPAKPAHTSLHVHFILNKSLLLIQHLLEEKKINLNRAFSASSDVIEGDPDQLEQAFLNLFFNGIEAMEPNGRLDVSTVLLPADAKIEGLPYVKGRRYLNVVVRDTGVGIPAENMDRLYEPFFTTKPEGTGLGLAITRRIVHEHQGIIAVQSEPYKGTAFSLIFPAREAVA